MWLRWMILAFVTNGLGPFGLKILAERGLSETYSYQYLFFWYGGGLLLALAALLAARVVPNRNEILLAALMGFGSFGGQLCTSFALEQQVPGHIVFPVTTGGNLFVVSAAGVLVFGEKVGPYGAAGIFAGILSLVLLSIG